MHSCHLKHFVYYGHLVLCDITSIMVGTVSICLFAALDGAKKTFMLLEFFAPCEGEVPWSCYARIIKVKIYKAIYKAKNKNKKSMRSYGEISDFKKLRCLHFCRGAQGEI